MTDRTEPETVTEDTPTPRPEGGPPGPRKQSFNWGPWVVGLVIAGIIAAVVANVVF